MDDAELFAAARAGVEFNDPLDAARARSLTLLLRAEGGRVLDLGCGQGSLLLTVLEGSPGATGDGVDLDAAELARARVASMVRGLRDRVSFHEADASAWAQNGYDVAMAVGASHAWGGTREAAAALAGHVKRGGRVLLADGFWAAPPTRAALAALDAEAGDLGDLDALLAAVRDAGLRVSDVSVASDEEWDTFEAAWRAGLETVDDPRARQLAADRRAGYEQGYRGVLGFAFVVGVKDA